MEINLDMAIPFALVFLQVLLSLLCMVFFISGIDEVLIDVIYIVHSLCKRLFPTPKHAFKVSEQDLYQTHEQPIAVMIPAWDESSVIRPMLENTLRSIDYNSYVIFVGVYPNDQDTQREVDKITAHHKNVIKVICRDDGPTNKADCLNWIYRGIKHYEQRKNIRFGIYVMQDCEDVIHPLCYKLLNCYLPHYGMVQLPVLSLPIKWHQFTAGHYVDEFAQGHYKDMVVRSLLSKSIPAAGVGCAFSSQTFDRVSKKNNGRLFNLKSLTEDYDFGISLKDYHLKQAFVKFSITRKVEYKTWLLRRRKKKIIKEYICIREFFPQKFRASVKQKSRWVIGIAFQGWANLGWRGGLITKYMLFRDRKAVITNLVTLLGYFVVVAVTSMWVFFTYHPDAYRYPPIIEEGTLLWYLIISNAGFLITRLLLRAYCVYRFYDVKQALLSMPRMIWGNAINFFATFRAIRIYTLYLITRKPIAWDKTDHSYPTDCELLTFPNQSTKTNAKNDANNSIVPLRHSL